MPAALLVSLALITAPTARPVPADPAAKLRSLLGVPYMDDGLTDARGRMVTFRHPGEVRPAPGLNCSGFVAEAARRLLGFRGSPGDAARDRRGDSGPGAPDGEDWDFGYDLVLNLSEGHAGRWLTAEGPMGTDTPARSLKGWPARDRQAWRRGLADLDLAHPGLVAFSRTEVDGRLRFHHVAVVTKDAAGHAWLWHTLPHGSVHRLDLDSEAGFDRLCTMFGPAVRVVVRVAEPV